MSRRMPARLAALGTALWMATVHAAAPPAFFPVCRVDPVDGTWRLEVGTSREGHAVTLLAPAGAADVHLDPRREAAGSAWYETATPIGHEGARYVPTGEEWSPGMAVNRYLRHIGHHAGVPVFDPWPLKDARTIAVLVRQDGCVFRDYRPLHVSPEPPSGTDHEAAYTQASGSLLAVRR